MQEDYTKIREQKMEALKKAGMNPYAYKFDCTHSAKEALRLKLGAKKIKIAGRLMLIRDMGRLCFAHIQDDSSRMQIAFNEKEIGKDKYKFFIKNFDLGDFIGVEGEIFKTHKGEKTLLVKKYEVLTKALLPLPEKWHGLQDKEERYRRRYLDLIMNPEVKEVFRKRIKILESLREFFNKRGFLEVDTPMLQPLYGGGAAQPFVSKLNSLDMKVYLTISNELYLKRLIVGGFDKIYSMNRVFRNEGIDSTHNPEFTILETMWAYVDYKSNMDIFEEMVEQTAKKVLGKTKIGYQGKTIELKRPWKRVTMNQAIKKYVGINVEKMSDKELKAFIQEKSLKLKIAFRRGIAIEEIFSELVQPNLIQPTIVYDYPADTSPLAKKKDKKPEIAERFETIINGWEMGNNYSELNNPQELIKAFKEQSEFRKRGDEEAAPYDKDFMEALQIGMPPTSGLGLGVDRLVMLLTDSISIRDVILFPFMRPEKD